MDLYDCQGCYQCLITRELACKLSHLEGLSVCLQREAEALREEDHRALCTAVGRSPVSAVPTTWPCVYEMSH